MSEITNRQVTRFGEERVRRVLLFLFPDRYEGAVLDESPDIICHQNSIGIEVTSCRDSQFREKDSIIGKITGKNRNDLTEKEKRLISNQDVFVYELPNGTVLSGYSMRGEEYNVEPVLKKKLVSLHKFYQLFSSNELFITAWMCDDIELGRMINTIYDINFAESRCFDRVYICREYKSNIEVYCLLKNEKKVFSIDSDTMEKISAEAKETVLQENLR